MSPLYHSLKPIYWLSLALGVSPFVWSSIPLKPRCELLLVTAVATLHLYVNLEDLEEWMEVANNESPQWNLGFQVYFAIKMIYNVATVLSLAVNVVRRIPFRRTIHILEQSDVALEMLNVKVNHRKERFVATLLWMCSSVVLVVYHYIAVFVYRKPGKRIDVWHTMWHLLFKHHFMSLFYVYAVVVQRAIWKRFVALNAALRKHFLEHAVEDPFEDKREVLLSLANLHRQLECAALLHSRSVGLQLLAFFLPYVLNGVHFLYLVYMVLEGSVEVSALVLLEVMWVGYTTVIHLLLVMTATCTTNEARRSGRIIHEVLNENRQGPLKGVWSSFSRRLYHLDVNLSCGMFEFDWSFFQKVLGITSTYLIILIQFKDY